MTEGPIINKVAESGLITIDLEDYLPKTVFVFFDMQPFLFKGLLLKEKEFREALKNEDWPQYSGKTVLIKNTTDAIIPMWAYMLVTSYLQPYASTVSFLSETAFRDASLLKNLENIEIGPFLGKRVVIKGCGETALPEEAYIVITQKLRPVVKSLMFGEACSTVPVFKLPLAQQKTIS